jgi:hypothetical protein
MTDNNLTPTPAVDPASRVTGDPITTDAPLTDEQVQALNAIQKYSLIQELVTKLVNEKLVTMNSTLTADEVVVLAEYRKWKQKPISATGVFHVRKPS